MEVDIENGNKHSNIVKKELDRIRKVGVERFQGPFNFLDKTIFLGKTKQVEKVAFRVNDYLEIIFTNGSLSSSFSFFKDKEKVGRMLKVHQSESVLINGFGEMGLSEVLLNMKFPYKHCFGLKKLPIKRPNGYDNDNNASYVKFVCDKLPPEKYGKLYNSMTNSVKNEIFDILYTDTSYKWWNLLVDITKSAFSLSLKSKREKVNQQIINQSKFKRLMLKQLMLGND